MSTQYERDTAAYAGLWNGMQVIVDDLIANTDIVFRPWRERWFTRPWHPFRKYERRRRDEPSRFYIDEKHNVIYTDSRGAQELREASKQRGF